MPLDAGVSAPECRAGRYEPAAVPVFARAGKCGPARDWCCRHRPAHRSCGFGQMRDHQPLPKQDRTAGLERSVGPSSEKCCDVVCIMCQNHCNARQIPARCSSQNGHRGELWQAAESQFFAWAKSRFTRHCWPPSPSGPQTGWDAANPLRLILSVFTEARCKP